MLLQMIFVITFQCVPEQIPWKYQSVPVLLQQTNTVLCDHDLNEIMPALKV